MRQVSCGRRAVASVLFILAFVMAAGLPAAAQVRDAIYRGTLVCTKLPFLGTSREAMEVAITVPQARYAHVVRETSGISRETGSGSLNGQNIVLTGGWRGMRASYEARYAGTFVRRSVHLRGTQTWVRDGRVYTRTCSGAIKRPLAAFLPAKRGN